MITLIVVLILLGLAWYFISGLPLDTVFKRGIFVVLCLIAIYYVARAFGVALP